MYRIVYIALVILFVSCSPKINDKTVKDSLSRPNVVIILTDDQGYHDVGFNGCEDIPTPNIDRIAKNGIICTNAYVTYAVCGPSRAGLITGRYQDRFGFGRNPLFAPNDPGQGLPTSEQTMSSVLKEAGYRTMAIGKWHLGAHETQRPLSRGFDEFFGFLTGGHMYFPDKMTLSDISEVKSQFDAYKTKLLRNNTRVEEKEYLTDAFSREAVNFIERNKTQPFFLYLAYNAPHTPMQATKKYLDRFNGIKNKKRRTYAAMVSAVDDGVGSILNKLKELKILDNTMIFYLSDNGGPEKHNASDNGPLREGKGSLYEGGIHVPFAVQWPNVLPGGIKYDKPVISLDIFSTVIKYAGAKAKNKLDGVDLVPYFIGKNKTYPHDYLFWRKFDTKAYAVRNRKMKLVNANGEKDEIYNLRNDIGEKLPIKDTTELVSLLKQKNEWNLQMKDPVFLGLKQNKQYNQLHPERFTLEKY